MESLLSRFTYDMILPRPIRAGEEWENVESRSGNLSSCVILALKLSSCGLRPRSPINHDLPSQAGLGSDNDFHL
jgi:hypothetical protein